MKTEIIVDQFDRQTLLNDYFRMAVLGSSNSRKDSLCPRSTQTSLHTLQQGFCFHSRAQQKRIRKSS